MTESSAQPDFRESSTHLAQLNQRVEAARIIPGANELPLVQRGYAWLENEFQQVLKLTRNLVGSKRLVHPDMLPLTVLGEQTLALARVIHSEIQRLKQPEGTSLSPTLLLKQLLDDCHDLLDLVQRQLLLLDGVEQIAGELDAIFRSLIESQPRMFEGPHFQQVTELVTQIISRKPVPHSGNGMELHLPLAIARLSGRFGATMARGYTLGITSAREVGRIAKTQWLRKERIIDVTAAALLQDMGCLLSQPEILPSKMPDDEKSGLMLKHPSIGAALVNGFKGITPMVGRIISQHHERLNGSGFPRGRSGADLSELSRLVIATARLQELRLNLTDPQEILPSSAKQVEVLAARQLIQEAQCGDLDRAWVDRCLSHLDPQTFVLGGERSPNAEREVTGREFSLQTREPHWPPAPHGLSESRIDLETRIHLQH